MVAGVFVLLSFLLETISTSDNLIKSISSEWV